MAPKIFSRLASRSTKTRGSRVHPTLLPVIPSHTISAPQERDDSAPTIPILPTADSKLSMTEPGDSPRKRRFISDMGVRIKRAMTGIFGKGQSPDSEERSDVIKVTHQAYPIVFQRPEEIHHVHITDEQRLEYQMTTVDQVFARAVHVCEQSGEVLLTDELLHETRLLMEMLRAEQSKIFMDGPKSCKSSLSSSQLDEILPQDRQSPVARDDYPTQCSISDGTLVLGAQQLVEGCNVSTHPSQPFPVLHEMARLSEGPEHQPINSQAFVGAGAGNESSRTECFERATEFYSITPQWSRSSLFKTSLGDLNLAQLFASRQSVRSLSDRHIAQSGSSGSRGTESSEIEPETQDELPSKVKIQRVGGSSVLKLASMFGACKITVPAPFPPRNP